MTVGILQIFLTWVLWRRRRDLRGLGGLALGAVCLQGALGALTVYLGLSWFVSLAHLAVGTCYFALLLLLAFRTRPGSYALPRCPQPGGVRSAGRWLRYWIAGAAIVVLLQILLGGMVRHTGAALACLDVPLCGGQLFPTDAPWRVILHMGHRIGGVVVAFVVAFVARKVFRSGQPILRLLACAAVGVVVIQIALGIVTILSHRHVVVAVLHFVGAQSLWALWIMTWLATGKETSRRTVSEESSWTPPVLLPSAQ